MFLCRLLLFITYLRSFLAHRIGASAVEFALLSPVFLLLLLGGIDFGLLMHTRMQLSSAVRAGIQYAMHHSADPDIVRQTVYGALTIETTDVDVSVTQSCECPGGRTVDCSSTCPSGRRRTFIYIAIDMPYTGLFNSIVTPSQLHSDATIRVD